MSGDVEFPMNGGDGANSYSKNSRYQVEAVNVVTEMIKEAIAKKFDVTSLSFSSNTIRIADLGCSVGPNTFIAMKNILEAIEWKYHSIAYPFPQNENTLFTTLPPDRQYFAAGVPGSFYGRLFPKSSIHLMYSSFALQWLSKVPEELLDNGSLTWNKGKIHYTIASKEIADVYAAQFAKDMDTFFNARADEIIVGGMMILIMPGFADGVQYSQDPSCPFFYAFNQSLLDMVKLGMINEDEVDSFNLPLYATSPKEMAKLVERNGCFNIERMEVSNTRPQNDGPPIVPAILTHYRVGLEGIFTKHFGSKIVDELFERTLNKSAEISSMLESSCVEGAQLFLVLKRK
ncbi:probable S-adenosylmethionine-dependent methyltransferase At5g38780 [Camellia sinensis]|uniref:probable S-adenosylmethionine-dependent methyltransferase At5g38780 n=1 Tax=Camellia sinensis TaxID=4442 RepID=UPI0010363CA5|nr:probable S-adenosylmethionine-dependent methyltransferase At5g38780 [Camellia sinensis]